ncbi:MAG: UDP-3-O-(3-hydroxymyristoyl)glucosamine N-acyltransferase [Elusimicrobiales bacterium]
MNLKVKEIASFLGLKFFGNGEKTIKRISSLENSDEESIVFLEKKNLKTLKAGCVICKEDNEILSVFESAIISPNPKLDFFRLVSYVQKEKKGSIKPKISEKSSVSKNSKVSDTAYIGDFVTVDDGAIIEDGAVISSGCFIGKNSKISRDTFIYPNAVVREDVVIGKRCIIHCGSVIGSDGFGYVREKDKHVKIPHIGGVIIGDDVEIGAGVCIERGTIDNTIIGDGTKIDNLVHIAHNVKVGRNCLILAQAGISGSTVIEDNVTIAGQAGLSDHIRIGENSIIMAQSGVIGNIEKNKIVFGTPARDRGEYMRIQATLSKLPEIYKYFFKKIKNEK